MENLVIIFFFFTTSLSFCPSSIPKDLGSSFTFTAFLGAASQLQQGRSASVSSLELAQQALDLMPVYPPPSPGVSAQAQGYAGWAERAHGPQVQGVHCLRCLHCGIIPWRHSLQPCLRDSGVSELCWAQPLAALHSAPYWVFRTLTPRERGARVCPFARMTLLVTNAFEIWSLSSHPSNWD